MILRIYAMWNQSRKILCVLLFIFMAQTVISIICRGIYTSPGYVSGMSQANSIVSMQSQTNDLTFLFSSDGGPNPRFLCMRYVLHHRVPRHFSHYDSPNYSQCHLVYSRSHPELQRVSRDVQSNEAMAAQSVHEASREGWNHLFPCVCLPPFLPSYLPHALYFPK